MKVHLQTPKIAMNYSKISFSLLFFFFFLGVAVNAQTPVRNEQGYILIDYDGEVLTESTYDYISKASSKYYIAVKNGLWGFLNNNGEVVIPLQYDVAYPFNGEFALVGKNGNYHQINKQNKVLNTIDWAQAPVVYNKQFLIVNNNKVFYKDGDLLLESQHRLINAPKSGIIEWYNNSDTAIQYIAQSGRKRLFKAYNHNKLDTFFITQQGYLGFVRTEDDKKFYSIYNDRGQQLVKMPAKGIHPNFMRVVWENFVYWPNGKTFNPDPINGREVHYPMQYLSTIKRNNKTAYTFQLSEKYFKDQMILLPQTNKWIQFDGSEVTGKYIFDNVVPGDDTYTPVKMGRNWYLLNRKKDTLGTTPFKYIHPLGMKDGQFFASTQDPGRSGEKWAFVNLEEGIVTDEIFGIPSVPRNDIGIFSETVFYEWNDGLNVVIKDGKKSYINNFGEIIWTNPTSKPITAQDFFKTEIKINQGNYKDLPSKHNFKKNKLSVRIEPSINGIEVSIANTAKTIAPIEIQDGLFQTKLEYKNTKGEWKVIAFLDPSWCGNSYYPIHFPANKMTTSQVNLPSGNTKTLIRVTLKVDHETLLNSNEITVSTNGSRMWILEYFTGSGSTYKR